MLQRRLDNSFVGLSLDTGVADLQVPCEESQSLAGFLLLLMKCCLMSTETIGLLGMGAQDVHLNFHTAPEL